MAIETSSRGVSEQWTDRSAGDQDLLFAVAARLNRLSSDILRDLDVPLTFRQYRTLARVAAGYTSMSQLAARANLTMPTVSETVDGLVRRKLLETKPSPSDGRAVILVVTDAGAKAAAAGDIALDEVLDDLTRDLSPDARQAFEASLKVVYDAATEYFDRQQQSRKR
jgi:DNA-binding MarR family transcriptional regulator